MKFSAKRVAGALTLAAAALIAAGRANTQNPGNTLDHNDSGQISTHYLTVQPPYQATGQSVYRENLTDVEASHVLGLNTTSFFWQNGMDHPYFWCPSRGGAVPNTAELTNPKYVQPDPFQSSGAVVVDNMDPDGVYPPSSSSGTYVMCIDSAGRDYLFYAEGEVTQISAAATWDFTANHGKGGIVVQGAPAMPVCTVSTVGGKAATVCTAPSGSTTPRVKG